MTIYDYSNIKIVFLSGDMRVILKSLQNLLLWFKRYKQIYP